MFHDQENPIEPEYVITQTEYRYNGTYGTGKTEPPKRRSLLWLWIVLAAVFVGSTVSILEHIASQTDTKPNTESAAADPVSSVEDNASFGRNPEGLQAILPTQLPTEDMGEKKDNELVIMDAPAAVPNIPQGSGLSLQAIYKKVSPSAVSVTALTSRGKTHGSGIIMTDSGYIITNCHVIEGGESLIVTLFDGRSCEADLVGKDEASDLAVLQIYTDGLTPAEFGNSDRVQVGDAAIAIGDPLGLELRGTMTEGIISAINRDLTVEGRLMTLLQTTAALNEGNSGGPLINCYGQVVGINTAKIGKFYSGGVEALGFAIPINTAKEIIDQLITQGFVSGRAALGVDTTVLDSQYRFFYDLPEGLYVTEVPEGSFAWQIGLRRGDTITSLAGVEIKTEEDLIAFLSQYKPGDAVKIEVYRSHRVLEGELVLMEAGEDGATP